MMIDDSETTHSTVASRDALTLERDIVIYVYVFVCGDKREGLGSYTNYLSLSRRTVVNCPYSFGSKITIIYIVK